MEIFCEMEDYEYLIKKEIADHAGCNNEHKTCSLEDTLQKLDAIAAVDQGSDLSTAVRDTILEVINQIAKTITDLDPRFRCNVQPKGSSFNNLKSGRPDEFDFLFCLDYFNLKETDGWKIIPDVKNNECQPFSVGLQNCYQVQAHTCKNSNIDKRFILKYFDIGNCLNSRNVKAKFDNLLLQAVQSLTAESEPRMKRTVDSICEVTSVGLYLSDMGHLLLKLPNIPFLIKLDVNPCIQYDNFDGHTICLVPSSFYETWQMANADPSELHQTKLQTCIRLLKTIRDLSTERQLLQSPNTTTYSAEECYLAIEKDSTKGDYFLNVESSRSLNFQHSLNTLRPFSSAMPSYAIMSTATHLSRCNPNLSLCQLVLSTIADFQFADVEGNALLMDGKTIKEGNILRRNCLLALLELKTTEILLENSHLPPWYVAAVQSLSLEHLWSMDDCLSIGLMNKEATTYYDKKNTKKAVTPMPVDVTNHPFCKLEAGCVISNSVMERQSPEKPLPARGVWVAALREKDTLFELHWGKAVYGSSVQELVTNLMSSEEQGMPCMRKHTFRNVRLTR